MHLKELEKFILIQMFNLIVLLNLRLLLTKVQFPLLSKLTDMYSKDIPEVLLHLLLVVPNLITVYSLLVMELKMVKDISLSKTHGDQAGVLTVMSKSLIAHPTSVVSSVNHPTQLNKVLLMFLMSHITSSICSKTGKTNLKKDIVVKNITKDLLTSMKMLKKLKNGTANHKHLILDLINSPTYPQKNSKPSGPLL
jgi:hypothetical protein